MRILTVVFIILALFGALLQMGCPKQKEVTPPVEEEGVSTPEEEVEEIPLEEEVFPEEEGWREE